MRICKKVVILVVWETWEVEDLTSHISFSFFYLFLTVYIHFFFLVKTAF